MSGYYYKQVFHLIGMSDQNSLGGGGGGRGQGKHTSKDVWMNHPELLVSVLIAYS